MGWYTPSAPPPTAGGLSGFLSNIQSEAHSLVSGLAGIGGMGLHDIKRAVMEGATLGHYQPATDEGYLLPHVAQALLPDVLWPGPGTPAGALLSDIGQRYGPLFNLDYKGFADQMYQRPLSFLMDVGGVGDIGASVAKHAALNTVREAGGEAAQTMGEALTSMGVGRTPEELAKFGVPMSLEDIVRNLPAVATSPKRAIPAAARAGLDIVAANRELTPLERFAQVMLTEPTKRLRGEELVASALHPNPVVRPIEELVRRTFTMPQVRFAAKADELGREVMGELNTNDLSKVGPLSGETIDTAKFSDWQRMNAVADEAKRLGIRLERPFVAKSSLWKAANDWYSGSSSVHLLHRQKDMQAFVDLIKPWMERFPDLKRTGYVFLNRLDKTLGAQWELDPWFEGTKVVYPDVPKSTLIDEPAMPQWLQGMPKREDRGVIGRLNEAKDRLRAMNTNFDRTEPTPAAFMDAVSIARELAQNGNKRAGESGYLAEKIRNIRSLISNNESRYALNDFGSSVDVQTENYRYIKQLLTDLQGRADLAPSTETQALFHARKLMEAIIQGDTDNMTKALDGIESLTRPDAVAAGAAGLPKRMYHGTSNKPYDQFDENLQDPGALFGPGFYHTDDPTIASSYSRSGRAINEPRTEVVKGDAAAIARRDELRSQGYIDVQLETEGLLGPHPSREASHTITYREPAPSHVRGSYLNIKNPFRPDDELTPEVLNAVDKKVRGEIDNLPVDIRKGLRESWQSLMENFGPDNIANTTGADLWNDLVDFHEEVTNRFAQNLELLPMWQDSVYDGVPALLRRHGIPNESIDRIQEEWDRLVDLDSVYSKSGTAPFTPSEILDAEIAQLSDIIEGEVGDLNPAHFPYLDKPKLMEELDAQTTQAAKDAAPEHAGLAARKTLEDAGFDGVTHQGGMRVGNKEHEVWIAWHPEQVKAGLSLPIQKGLAPEHAAWFDRVLGADVAGRASELDMGAKAGLPGKNTPMLTVLDDATRKAAHPNYVKRADRILSELNSIIDDGHLTPEDMALVPRLQDTVIRSVQRSVGVTVEHADYPQFVDDIRLQVMQDAIDQLETGTVDIQTILERPYRALRYAYGARVSRETGLLEGGPSWMELDDAFRNAGEAPPVYFPFISKQRSSLADYFRSTQRTGYAQASADPHHRFMEGVLLKKGDFIRDPMEAYARRAARGVRAEETYNTMQRMVSQFGRRIQSSDELGRNEVVIAPRYLFMKHKLQRLFEDFVDDQIMGGAERELAINKGMDYVMKDVQDEIINMASDEQAGIEMYAVPRVVADRLNDAQRFAGFGGKWAAFVDEPMKVWRNMVLLGRPAWVLNNLLGNVLFGKMQGSSLIDAMRLLENRYVKLINERFGTNFSHEFLDQLERLPGHGDVSSGFFSTIGQFTAKNPTWENSALGKTIKLAQSHAPRRALSRYGDFVKTVNRELESAFRDASYLTALERNAGYSATKRTFNVFMKSRQRIDDLIKDGVALGTKEVPGIGAKYALAEVDQFFGNYTRLTPFERHIVRRFIFPWWGFYRHQLKLLLTFPMNYPARAKVLQGLSLATQDMMSAYGPVPDWLQGSVPIGPPGMEGATPFISTRGPNPFEGSFTSWSSQLSPPLKILLERAQGRSAFTGDPFTDKDIIQPYGSDQQYRIIYDDNGFPIDAQPTGNVLPSFFEHILQQIPQYQMLKQSIAGGRTFDTSSLMDILLDKQGNVKRDPATGEPLFPTSLMEQLQKLLGFSTVNYDLNNYQDRLASEQKQVLKEALNRMSA